MAKIRIVSTLDSRQYKQGVKQMSRGNKTFKDGLGGISKAVKAAFAVTAVLAFVKGVSTATLSIINFGSKITDQAAQTGLAVEKLQMWQGAVRDAGQDSEKLVQALIKVKDAQGTVISEAEGFATYQKAFENLGLSVEDLESLSPDEIFERMAKRLTESGNAAGEFAAVLDIVGARGGGRLIEVFNAIGQGADGLRDDLQILSNENAQILDEAADRWENFKNNFKVRQARVLSALFKGLFGTRGVEEREVMEERRKEMESLARTAAATEAEKKKALDEEKTIQQQINKLIEEQNKLRGGALVTETIPAKQEMSEGVKEQADASKKALDNEVKITKEVKEQTRTRMIDLSLKTEEERKQIIEDQSQAIIDAAKAQGRTAKEAFRDQVKITQELERQKQVKEVQAHAEEIQKKIKIEIDTDSIRRLGGNVGGQVDKQILEARRRLKVQEEMAKLLSKIQTNTAKPNQAVLAP